MSARFTRESPFTVIRPISPGPAPTRYTHVRGLCAAASRAPVPRISSRIFSAPCARSAARARSARDMNTSARFDSLASPCCALASPHRALASPHRALASGLRCLRGASARGASLCARAWRVPSSESTAASSMHVSPSLRANAPIGTWQPPSSSRRMCRSAITHASVSVQAMARHRVCARSSPWRTSTPMAPCPTAGTMSATSIAHAMRSLKPMREIPATARITPSYAPLSALASRVSTLPRISQGSMCG